MMKPVFHMITENAIASKIPHAVSPSRQSKRILGEPRAKIIASRLQYLILLMRLVASDNISHRYPRVSSLNKPSITCQSFRLITRHTYYAPRFRHCDTGNAHHWQRWLRHWQGMSLKESLFLWRRDGPTTPPHAPMRDSSQCGNPSPHKNCLFVCQYSLLTSLMCCSCAKVVC